MPFLLTAGGFLLACWPFPCCPHEKASTFRQWRDAPKKIAPDERTDAISEITLAFCRSAAHLVGTTDSSLAVPFAPVPVADGLALHAGADTPAARRLFTPEASALVVRLHRALSSERARLLAARDDRQAAWDAGAVPERVTLPEAADDWQVAPLPADLLTRRVEITGPVNDPRMVITMLSRTESGHRADCAMLDFEDSLKPSWENVTAGVGNVAAVASGTLAAVKTDADGTVIKEYRLDPTDRAVALVRVRGLHLGESNVRVDGETASAGLVDLALCAVHAARQFVENGDTPAFYVPKVEHHEEAAWWSGAFALVEDALGLPLSTLRATFLIETLPAALQMEAVLYAARDHAAGLNVGRWDKIFSDIKCLRAHPDRVLADRATIGLERPWMRAYAEELIAVCHRHGAAAMGGMAAFTPGRDAERRAEQTAKVVADKAFEAALGHDGCWVSHPYFIGTAMDAFTAHLGDAPNQFTVVPDLGDAPDLLPVGGGPRTLDGLRTNVRVGIAYLKGWREDIGCVAWDDLMEDLATLEISRAQTHQWLRHGIALDSGEAVTEALVRRLFAEEKERLLIDLCDTLGHDCATLGAELGAWACAADAARDVFVEPEMRPFLSLASDLAPLAAVRPGTAGDGASVEAVPLAADPSGDTSGD